MTEDVAWDSFIGGDDEVDAERILRLVRARMATLAPAVKEYDRLTEADAALDRALKDARA